MSTLGTRAGFCGYCDRRSNDLRPKHDHPIEHALMVCPPCYYKLLDAGATCDWCGAPGPLFVYRTYYGRRKRPLASRAICTDCRERRFPPQPVASSGALPSEKGSR